MIELIFAVCFAVFISAGCSLIEAVLYSTPMRYVETMVRKNRSSGKIFKDLRKDIHKPITAILSLNTIANTAGAAVAGSAATAVFGYEWLAYFSIFFTLIILVFSEVIPKTAGVVYAKPLMPFVALPLKFLVKLMTPAVWLCTHVTKLISKEKSQESISPEELKTLAQLSLRMGEIKGYQELVIDRILSLETRTVKNVMTPRTVIFSLDEHLTLIEASEELDRWEHSRVPVYDKDSEDIVGIVLTKELFIALAEDRGNETLSNLMRPVHFVVESAKLNNVLMEFISKRDHLFVVIDEYGGLAGIITLEDILEEILGHEIMDESDQVADKRNLAKQRRRGLMSRSHDKE
jgi:CBS domain containing-hemolysin-like protein